MASEKGFRTGVSIEPIFDSANVVWRVTHLTPFVNESIWIGKRNDIENRAPAETETDRAAIQRIIQNQTDQRIREIHDALRDHLLIK